MVLFVLHRVFPLRPMHRAVSYRRYIEEVNFTPLALLLAVVSG